MNLGSGKKSDSLRAPRLARSHKYSHGHVAAIVGSEKFPGAAILSLGAALRGGAGYVCNLSINQSIDSLIWQRYPEVTIAQNLKDLKGDSWLVGSGLTMDRMNHLLPYLQAEIQRNLESAEMKGTPFYLTLDAAAMQHASHLRNGFTIITPHEGEALSLGMKEEDLINRKQAALNLAQRFNVIVVLKGFHTIIAAPSGFWMMDKYGGPELAVAGSGDILAGLIASFLGAFKPTTEKNVVIVIAKAIKAHGLAGRYSSRRLANPTASDILNSLQKVIR